MQSGSTLFLGTLYASGQAIARRFAAAKICGQTFVDR